MDSILTGVSSFIKSGDTQKKFKIITDNEFIDELMNKNQTPFLDVIGLKQTKTPISGFNFKDNYKEEYLISIVIVQDAKAIKNVIKGETSVWKLWSYVWGIIETDKTFNGLVRGIKEQSIESKIMSFTKDNSVKVALETELVLYKDVFKQ